MDYFDDIRFYRFNHLLDHRETVDRSFDTYCLNYLPAGRIHWQFDRNKATYIHGPCAYWLWPGPRWRYRQVDGEPWEHYFVSVTGSRPRRWCRHGLFVAKRTPPPVRTITNPGRFRDTFDHLIEVLGRSPGHEPEAVHLLEGLLLQLHRQPSPEAVAHPRRAEVMALVRRLEAQPERICDFTAEAEALAMSPTHLRRLFRLFVGTSPVAYQNRQRLDRAARQLRSSRRPIKQIAVDNGYADVFYFTRAFTRQYRMAPGAYRRAYQSMAAP